jgi:hypothetical protein
VAIDREYVLREIKRTAHENGGVPLGMDRFRKETGIRERDWRGRFWARWSDALLEAGYSPNSFNKKYDDQFLIEKYLGIVRRLGRNPTDSEVQLATNSDSSLPSAKPFRRFGTKARLIGKVAEYCRQQGELDDVLKLCEAAATSSSLSNESANANSATIGFVYLLKSGRYFKVGRSNAAGRREREIALQLPEKANTVHVIRTDDPPGIEAYWHKRFESKRKNGEWFELDRDDISAFKRRKFM